MFCCDIIYDLATFRVKAVRVIAQLDVLFLTSFVLIACFGLHNDVGNFIPFISMMIEVSMFGVNVLSKACSHVSNDYGIVVVANTKIVSRVRPYGIGICRNSAVVFISQ